MLEIKNLNQYYGSSHTLHNIDLSVKQGDCIAVMGRNGVGKTTLVESIMGIVPIKTGTMHYLETDLNKTSQTSRASMQIGYVPQGRRIFPFLTVLDNLRIGLGARKDKQKDIPEFIFELFPVLKTMLNRQGGDLSGGQQQQLAIGRALVLNPKLLILDEPTEGIQPNIISEICGIINKLNNEYNMTVILVEQKLPIARKIARNFVIMDRGTIVCTGKMDELNNEVIQEYLTV